MIEPAAWTSRSAPRRPALRLAALALVVWLGGCYEVDTTPRHLAPYYGEWQGPDVTLTITPRRIDYRRRGGVFDSALVQAPFRGIAGADIVYGTKRSRLRVDAPPRRVGTVWRMTVEGRPLERR